MNEPVIPSPLSVDLRERVVATVAEGAFFHRLTARFGLSVSSASHWSPRFAPAVDVALDPTCRNNRLPAIEARAGLFLITYETRLNICLRELRDVEASRTACRPTHAACRSSSCAEALPVKEAR